MAKFGIFTIRRQKVILIAALGTDNYESKVRILEHTILYGSFVKVSGQRNK